MTVVFWVRVAEFSIGVLATFVFVYLVRRSWRRSSQSLLAFYVILALLANIVGFSATRLVSFLTADPANELAGEFVSAVQELRIFLRAFAWALAANTAMLFVSASPIVKKPKRFGPDHRVVPIAAAVLSCLVTAIFIYIVPLLYVAQDAGGNEIAIAPRDNLVVAVAIAVGVLPEFWSTWVPKIIERFSRRLGETSHVDDS